MFVVENAHAQASEKKHFHSEEEVGLVAAACPNIRRVIFKLSPDNEATSCLHLVEFQQLQQLEMWGGGFRRAKLDQLLEVVGPNLRQQLYQFLYFYRGGLFAALICMVLYVWYLFPVLVCMVLHL